MIVLSNDLYTRGPDSCILVAFLPLVMHFDMRVASVA